MDQGRVVAVSPDGVRVMVKSGGVVTTFDLIGDEGAIEVGDVLRGDWTCLGRETIWRGYERFEVCIEDWR